MLLTVVSFALVLGVLIFVHELGHFMAAKWVGIGIPRFSIGFGPATPIRFRIGETEYVVAWFPLGGYVKMASREEQEAMSGIEGRADQDFPPEKLFESKSVPARAVVLFAGVAMNVLFAWVAYVGLAATYGRPEDPTTTIARVDSAVLPPGAAPLASVPRGAKVVRINGDTVRSRQQMEQMLLDPTANRLVVELAGRPAPIELDLAGLDSQARLAIVDAIKPMWEPRIGRMSVDMPAYAAGLRPGDLLVFVNGDTVAVFADLQDVVDPAAGDTLVFTALREDSLFDAIVVPEEVTIQDPRTGEQRVVGRIGVDPAVASIRVRFGLAGAVLEGGRQTVANVALVLGVLKGMLVGVVSVRDLGGPILIGQVAGEAAQAGLVPLLLITAFLSVDLAVLNLLPIPVLDGGHLVFLLIEGVRGRPLPLGLRLRLTQVGMLVLVGIMLLAFANDFMRLLQ